MLPLAHTDVESYTWFANRVNELMYDAEQDAAVSHVGPDHPASQPRTQVKDSTPSTIAGQSPAEPVEAAPFPGHGQMFSAHANVEVDGVWNTGVCNNPPAPSSLEQSMTWTVAEDPATEFENPEAQVIVKDESVVMDGSDGIGLCVAESITMLSLIHI